MPVQLPLSASSVRARGQLLVTFGSLAKPNCMRACLICSGVFVEPGLSRALCQSTWCVGIGRAPPPVPLRHTTSQIHFIRVASAPAHRRPPPVQPTGRCHCNPPTFTGWMSASQQRTHRPVSCATTSACTGSYPLHRHGIYRWGQPVTASQTQGQQAGPDNARQYGPQGHGVPSMGWTRIRNRQQAEQTNSR